MEEKLDIIAIGESLIELSTEQNLTTATTLDKYYGGDTLTSAIAALKLGAKVGFISRIGMDCFKEYLIESWAEEGLDISHVKPVEGVNGIYFIALNNAECGKKEFALYRKKTAATNLSIDDISPDYIKNSSIVYATGITQSLSISAREAVKKAFEIAKENNITVAYDPNFTNLIWSKDEAKEAFEDVKSLIDVIFINEKRDTDIILENASADNVIKYLHDMGISTVIVKSTEEKVYKVSYKGNIEFIKFLDDDVVNDTGAGDAFNGGVLYGLSAGMSAYKSAALASVVSGLQIKGIGAIKSLPEKDAVYSIFKGMYE
ncbi:sugar kinase [bacterium]|nr:sugar kinase [bacterium]